MGSVYSIYGGWNHIRANKVHIMLTNAFFFDRLAPSNDKEE